MDHRLNEMEQAVKDIREAIKRRSEPGGASSNGNVVRLEGAGSIWNGIAIGLSIAGVIAGMVWISSVASNAQVAARQAEAYRAAVYIVAPKLAEEVDKELERQKERESK